MDLDEIKQILEMMREHELSEFELERDAFKLRIRKHAANTVTAASPVHITMPSPPPMPAAPPPAAAPPAGMPVLTDAHDEIEFAIVKSPIVGTFYRSPEPGARAFAEVGDAVKKGQVLCIIEAMKLMNEINAEVEGELIKVYVENGQAVQYGERLFAIRPSP
jgi:acetyl-CoA carboxylase biotin carboxyl carrier protein